MNRNTFYVICNIVFGLYCAGLFYLMPYIAWHTMEGDKTDILMGMMLGIIPIGLLLISFLYGFLVKKIAAPLYIASVSGIPAVFIPIVAGDTISERLLALLIIIPAILTIVCAGTAPGIFIRRLLQKNAPTKQA